MRNVKIPKDTFTQYVLSVGFYRSALLWTYKIAHLMTTLLNLKHVESRLKEISLTWTVNCTRAIESPNHSVCLETGERRWEGFSCPKDTFLLQVRAYTDTFWQEVKYTLPIDELPSEEQSVFLEKAPGRQLRHTRYMDFSRNSGACCSLVVI